MSENYTFDNIHNDIAVKVSKSKKYRYAVDKVQFMVAEDGTPMTTMTILGAFKFYITSINDEFGDMFNIVAVRVKDGSGRELSRPSVVGREAGSVKDLEREITKLITKVSEMN